MLFTKIFFAVSASDWARKDSNLRPMDYESTALTAELRALTLHSDKFALTLHPTSRYYKKIKCKLYYFGTDELNSPFKRPAKLSFFAHDVQLVLTFACSTALITTQVELKES